MFAVFTEGRLLYLGECQTEAIATFNANPKSTLRSVANADELSDLIGQDTVTDSVSEAFSGLVEKLDELGINRNLAEKLRDDSVKMVGEAKSLGIRGMKAVGEGFIALGELLRQSTEDEPKECEKGHNCCRHTDHQEHGGEA